MKKIRIVEPGWQGYTGLLGLVEFVDGVSAEEVSRMEAERLGGIMRFEEVDTGRDPSIGQVMVEANAAKPVETAVVASTPAAKPVVLAGATKVYTGAELEAIADKGGIKALREISDPMGLKAHAIGELISKILSAQDAAAKLAAAAK